MATKTKHIVSAKLGADGKIRHLSATGSAGRTMPGRVDKARLDGLAAFAPDDDMPILTRREVRELAPVEANVAPNIAAMRRRLRLSQGAFAHLFGIPLATVKDWEQGRRLPDAPARAYLRVIAQNPKAVRQALEAAR